VFIHRDREVVKLPGFRLRTPGLGRILSLVVRKLGGSVQ